jgi:hypothetical protein
MGQPAAIEASAGKLLIYRFWSVAEMGIGNPEPQVDRVIREFVRVMEGVALHRIEMPGGILFLQMIPNDPQSGAIFIYDRQEQVFYDIWFEDRNTSFTVDEFRKTVNEYQLLRYIANPELLHLYVQQTGSA